MPDLADLQNALDDLHPNVRATVARAAAAHIAAADRTIREAFTLALETYAPTALDGCKVTS
jgi:hypothetical protein